LVTNSESNQEDPDLIDHTFRKLKKKNLLKINSKPTKSQPKSNARDTTETETENETEIEQRTVNQKSSHSILRVNNQVNKSKVASRVKITIEQTSSDESENEESQLKNTKRGKSRLDNSSFSQNTSTRSKRLSKTLDSSKNIETLTINDTTENDSSSEDKELEQSSRVLRRSLGKEQIKIHEPIVSNPTKSKSSIKITKLNPSSSLKSCHVALTRLDESHLSQNKKQDNSINEDEESRRSTRINRNSPQPRSSRDSTKNHLLADVKGKDASRRCVSLNNNNSQDHGSDNEPPKKVARRTPSTQSELKNQRSGSAVPKNTNAANLRQSPRRCSPR
jgi:hypothetical protein